MLAPAIRELALAQFADAEIAAQTGAAKSYIRAVRSRYRIAATRPAKRGPKPGPRPYRRKARQ